MGFVLFIIRVNLMFETVNAHVHSVIINMAKGSQDLGGVYSCKKYMVRASVCVWGVEYYSSFILKACRSPDIWSLK